MRHLGDITKINGAEIEPVWCITGGSPCQDLSIAGKRAGLAGERSGLFMEQVRIVKEMREADERNGRTGNMVRPRFLVWENVVGAFSSNKGQDFAAVLKEIIKIVEPEAPSIEVPEKGWPSWGGYHDEVGGRWSVVWRTHNAQYWGKTIRDSRTGDVLQMGTPQRRRRISVVADFGGDAAGEILFEHESLPGYPAESGAAGEGPAEAAEAGFNPAVARSLTARADGSPCADRDPNIVCSPQQGGRDGGGKGALVQTEKSGTLGTGNDQMIFCMATQQGGAELRTDDRAPTLTAAAGMSGNNQPVVAIPINDKATRWQGGGESRNHDGSGNGLGIGIEGDPSPTLTAGDRHGVMCAGFKLGNSEQARSIGYQEELSPTLNAECGGNKPAVVAPSVAMDMTHACDVIRECGEQVPALQARMETGGNQVPLTYQDVAGTLSPGAHAGSYNGQDAYNDMLVFGAENPDVAHTLRAKASCAYREDAETYPVQNMVVRRLTPMECERLQGFPDGWTDIGDWVKTDKRGRKIKVKGSADSPRYKALGNSIALPFWQWMIDRMAKYLPENATLGSLFDGLGGFPLCWSRTHSPECCRWASEIEPFPIAVTKMRFGEE